MFNKKERKTEGSFIDQTKRNVANSIYKFATNTTSKINHKIQDLTKNAFNQITEIIENSKNNREFNKFYDSFNKEKFFEELKHLIEKKFLQGKTNTFLKISHQDIYKNLNFFSFDYNSLNESINEFLDIHINLFYDSHCSLWETNDNKMDFYKFNIE